MHCHSDSFPSVIASQSSERSEEAANQSHAKKIWQQLQKKNIFVRYFDSPRLKDCLRISVGKSEDTDALIKALKEIC
jgi:histidinol-phosphate/aromatic aminotransferase/cobyric acid decarboxylase-like protein